jgi:hypothetical protein
LIRRDAAAVARAFLPQQDQEAPAGGAKAEEERGNALGAFAEAVEKGLMFYCG